MKKRIFNNIGLKLLAIFIAVAVWWMIVNIDDPLVKKNITALTVELRNTEALTDKGYIYDVVSGSTVSITVRVPQSIANDLKASDFTAYADLSQLSPLTDSAAIEIECVKDEIRSQIVDITSKTQVVKLSIDNKESADIAVSIELTGSPATDYVIGDQSLSPASIQVTGAATIIDSIARAVVSYDVSNMTSSISEKAVPVFYDEEGNVIDSSSLEVNRSSLKLDVDILPTKWVNINYSPSGTVADGYKMTGYTQNILQVKLAGTKENLANISSVDLPTDLIVVDGIKEDTEYVINIASRLSGAYRIVSETKELIVNVAVEPLFTEKFEIPCSAFIISNLADKLDIEWIDEGITVEISAIQSVLDQFNLDALNTSVDFQGMGEGEYEVVVHMTDGENFDIIGTYTVGVVVFDKEEGNTAADNTHTTTEQTSTEETTTSRRR